MTKPKTRCRQCFYVKTKVIQEPCSKCEEIFHSDVTKFENKFLDGSKDLMREE